MSCIINSTPPLPLAFALRRLYLFWFFFLLLIFFTVSPLVLPLLAFVLVNWLLRLKALLGRGARTGKRGRAHTPDRLLLVHQVGHKLEGVACRQGVDVAVLVLKADAVALGGDFHQLGAERGRDELRCVGRRVGLALDHRRDRRAVRGVEGLVEFVKEVERRRVAALNGEDDAQGHQGLLPPRELRHEIHLAVGRERHLNLHPFEVVHHQGRRRGRCRPFRLLLSPCSEGRGATPLAVSVLLRRAAIFSVRRRAHDELASPKRDKLFEHLAEVLRHPFEGPQNGLVFLQVQGFNELVDGFGALVELRATPQEGLALLAEVHVLVQRFLVHVAVLGELLVHLVQLLHQLFHAVVRVLLKLRGGQRAELLDLAQVLLTLLREHRSLVQLLLRLLLHVRQHFSVVRLLCLQLPEPCFGHAHGLFALPRALVQ
mmetsp:Transcript_64828/g.127286  ORF Transcript_64828/g.127286 Transcript_64828/m.127286 type:complete len:429 (-) Transcript_64828:2825-4111(-)